MKRNQSSQLRRTGAKRLWLGLLGGLVVLLLGMVRTPAAKLPAIQAPDGEQPGLQGLAFGASGQRLASRPTPQLAAEPQPADLLEQGRLLYEAGQFEAALTTWQKAVATSEKAGDRTHRIRSQINQAQALKALGNYHLALEILQQLDAEVPLQPPSAEKAQILRSLGDTYQAIGDLPRAKTTLQSSLAVAQDLQSGNGVDGPQEISAAYLSLGLLARAEMNQNRLEPLDLQAAALKALDYFQQVNATTNLNLSIQTKLNQISLLVAVLPQFNNYLISSADHLKEQKSETLNYFLTGAGIAPPGFSTSSLGKLKAFKAETVQSTADLLVAIAAVRPQLQNLPPTQATVNAQINFAQSLTRLRQVDRSAAEVEKQYRLLLKASQQRKQPVTQPQVKSLDWLQSPSIAQNTRQVSVAAPPFLPDAVRRNLQAVTVTAFPTAAEVLKQAVEVAQTLPNKRLEASARTALAELYGLWAQSEKQLERWPEVETLARQAIALTQESNAADIAYRAQWQLVRALTQRGNGKTPEARAVCRVAAQTLQSFRQDLVAINQDVQFTFQESIEPFYRECAVALLPSEAEAANQEQPAVQKNLEDARQLIESLQLAELDNYLKEACVAGQRVAIDTIIGTKDTPQTAVIYPILLQKQLFDGSKPIAEKQLGIIAKIPGQGQGKQKSDGEKSEQKLRYYEPELAPGENIIKTLTNLQVQLAQTNTAEQIQGISKDVYRWLMAPIEAELQTNQIGTLVFVPDGVFRNVPMSVLYNEKAGEYLIEKYAIAVSPGLQLLDPKPISSQKLNVLAAALSKLPPDTVGFDNLLYVKEELAALEKTKVVTRSLSGEDFTNQKFAALINAAPFNVVHLATHGKFSSQKDSTFILTYSGLLKLDQLSEILQSRSRNRPEAIELLVLSACQTASGDDRSTLGLAGIALKSGVRSTLASLWKVDDQATATLMEAFYTGLESRTQPDAGQKITKAKALQAAQLKLIKDHSPNEWAPYVLVGNWL